MVPAESIPIQFAYATNTQQYLLNYKVPVGTTVAQAIQVAQTTLQISLPSTLRIGIYNQEVSPDTIVQADDRIEIYRLLEADPKTARRKRVIKPKNK
jgi:hypothetical protein